MNWIVMTNRDGRSKRTAVGGKLDPHTVLGIYRDVLLSDGFRVTSQFDAAGKLLWLNASRGNEFYTLTLEGEPLVIHPIAIEPIDDATPMTPCRWLLNPATMEEKLVVADSGMEQALVVEGWIYHAPR